MSDSRAFEVFCPNCRVSFPVGTKTCLHCGGRTTKPRREADDFDVGGARVSNQPIDIMPAKRGGERTMPGSADVMPDEEGEEEFGRSPVRTILNVLFILFAIGISIMRACTENG